MFIICCFIIVLVILWGFYPIIVDKCLMQIANNTLRLLSPPPQKFFNVCWGVNEIINFQGLLYLDPKCTRLREKICYFMYLVVDTSNACYTQHTVSPFVWRVCNRSSTTKKSFSVERIERVFCLLGLVLVLFLFCWFSYPLVLFFFSFYLMPHD